MTELTYSQDIDKENMLNVLDNFWKQCRDATLMANDIKIPMPVENVLIGGMGGSALAGDVLTCYIGDQVPIYINRTYNLPNWVNKKTLAFIVSYSGNTEETLDMYRAARRQGCKIVLMASDGKLKEIARKDKMLFIELPKGIQPRDSTGYQTISILNVLKNSGIVRNVEDYENVINTLRKDHKEKAKDIAKRLVDKIPIFYSSKQMYCLSRIWKIKINENSKVQAYYNEFPEMNHNEMVGYTDLKGDYYLIFIEDKDDHPRIKKRFEITKGLLQQNDIKVLSLKLSGSNKLARIFSAILLGSYVGYYLALAYGTDPSPVVMVEHLKKLLKK